MTEPGFELGNLILCSVLCHCVILYNGLETGNQPEKAELGD